VTTSAPAGSANPALLHFQPESLPARVLGVLHSPRQTFESVAASPRSAGVLALCFLVTLVANATLFRTEVGRLALVDQWERTAIAFGQMVDDRTYAAMVEASRNGLAYAAATALASGPVLVIAASALLFAVLNRAVQGRATYRQVFAVTAHAGVILALRQVIAAPVSYLRETVTSPATLNVFVSMIDEASLVARFSSIIDLFVIWWIVALAIGTSVLYRRPARTLAVTFIGAYIALALVLAMVMAVTGGTA
jgi:hypothetical protein